VVLRSEGGHGRKGLPNSFLNRFVKLAVPSLSIDVKLSFLMGKYANMAEDGLLLGVVKQILEKEKTLPI
jgi:midasin (ATPase involved in ribosome maturation)